MATLKDYDTSTSSVTGWRSSSELQGHIGGGNRVRTDGPPACRAGALPAELYPQFSAEARSVSHALRVSTKVSTYKLCGKFKRLTLNPPHRKSKGFMI